MKKTLAIILCLFVSMGMYACNSQIENTNENTNDKTIDQSSSSANDPNSSIVENNDNWSVEFYVDEFQQQTNEWYITNKELFFGKFSNSATTNSKLSVRALFDGRKQWSNDSEYTLISFILYEYGSNQVKNPYSTSERYDIQLRDDNGKEYSGLGVVAPKTDRIFLEPKTSDKLLEFMETSEKVSIYIKDDSLSSYLFSITTENFFDLYK